MKTKHVYTVVTIDGIELVLGAYATEGAATRAMKRLCEPESSGPLESYALLPGESAPKFGTRWTDEMHRAAEARIGRSPALKKFKVTEISRTVQVYYVEARDEEEAYEKADDGRRADKTDILNSERECEVVAR